MSAQNNTLDYNFIFLRRAIILVKMFVDLLVRRPSGKRLTPSLQKDVDAIYNYNLLQ